MLLILRAYYVCNRTGTFFVATDESPFFSNFLKFFSDVFLYRQIEKGKAGGGSWGIIRGDALVQQLSFRNAQESLKKK